MEPQWAIILDIWKEAPVYHSESTVSRGSTRCGRVIADGKPFLPHKHAKKFARPCRGCFQAK